MHSKNLGKSLVFRGPKILRNKKFKQVKISQTLKQSKNKICKVLKKKILKRKLKINMEKDNKNNKEKLQKSKMIYY